MPFPSPKIRERIRRFEAGESLARIAAADGVKPITVYHCLRDRNVLTDRYLADEFLAALGETDLPAPVHEYHFVREASPEQQQHFLTKTGKPRAWRADLAWPWHRVAVEIDGGRHMPRGGAHAEDREKRNAYACLGWRLLSFDTDMLLDNVAACVEIVRLALTPGNTDL